MQIDVTASSVDKEKANLEKVFKKKDKFTPAEIEILNKYHSGFIPLAGGYGDGAKGPVNKFFVNSYEFNYGTGNTSNGSILEAKKIKGKVNDLKTVESIKEYLNISTVENVPSFGAFLREGFCFVDIDDQEQIEKVEELIKNKNEFFDNITIMRTGYHKKENTKRGYHFPFKIPKDFKYKQQTFTGLFAGGLIGELRLSGYELLKLNGECREFENIGEIRELPIIFHPAKAKVEVSPVLNLSENRNNALTSMRGILEASKRFTYEQIEQAFLFLNNNILASPLSEQELYNTVLRKNFSTTSIDILKNKERFLLDDLEEEEERLLKKVLFEEKGANLYQKLGEWFCEKFNVIRIGSNLYSYNNGIYSPLEEIEIKSYLNRINPFTKNQISEITEKIKTTHNKYIFEKDNKKLIPFKNGYINLNEADTVEEVKLLKVHSYTPDIKFFFKIPFNWNPAILENIEVKDFVDKFFSDIACGQQEYITKLFEFGAISLWRSNQTIYKKAFFLTGKGANGKSTYIEFVTYCIGESNTSKVSPYYLSDKFRQGILQNKLLNFDDDIGYKRFQAEPLKKAVTGNELTCEEKFKKSFIFRPYCSFIYGCNSIPNNDDFSSAMERRLCIIEFNADFSKNSKNRDVNFSNKIQNPKMAEYFLVRSVEYLKKILLNGGNMEESPLCDNSVEEYISSSSPVIGFLRNWIKDRKDDYIKDSSYNPKYPLQDVRLDDLYNEYKEYCRNDNRRESNDLYKGNFSKEICREANCKTKRKTKNGRKETYFYYPQIETIEEAIDEEYSPF